MHDCLKKLPGAFFLSFPEKKDFLVSEIEERFPEFGKAVFYGDLLYYPDASVLSPVDIPYWCSTAMLEASRADFSSIGEAAGILKGIQRSWGSYQFTQFRRSSLIQEKLPYINTKDKNFPFEIPRSPIGLYTLLDANHMVFSGKTTSSLPAGLIRFVEDHENPPSRAYLKIQESLVRFSSFFGQEGLLPGPGQRCFDAGACPGGWTWVLRKLGCKVFAVDRAPLADSLMNDPEVSFMTHDAFTLKPQELGFFDWVFSDVICYPERLYDWILMWLESGMCRNMICTIKMQGETDWKLVEKFADIPNSRVLHLCYNKHELTWLHSGQQEGEKNESDGKNPIH
ncbi:MAG: SAM-dependent methyltransferase [Treponemataceae bacterium]|nr:SAM-dependent methyltransferase [Treponemataceae bacterium]